MGEFLKSFFIRNSEFLLYFVMKRKKNYYWYGGMRCNIFLYLNIFFYLQQTVQKALVKLGTIIFRTVVDTNSVADPELELPVLRRRRSRFLVQFIKKILNKNDFY